MDQILDWPLIVWMLRILLTALFSVLTLLCLVITARLFHPGTIKAFCNAPLPGWMLGSGDADRDRSD